MKQILHNAYIPHLKVRVLRLKNKTMERVTIDYLISKGFEKEVSILGWTRYIKGEFGVVEIPLKNGNYVIGFEYNSASRHIKYKYLLKVSEFEFLYKFLTNEEL